MDLKFRAVHNNKCDVIYAPEEVSEEEVAEGGGFGLDWFFEHVKNEESPHLLDGNWTVDMWTGLKDMNGEEIYENDIIKLHSKSGLNPPQVGTVGSRNNQFTLTIDRERRLTYGLKDFDIEKIGNAHGFQFHI